MYNMSREDDEVNCPKAQFSTGVESEDMLEMSVRELSDEQRYFSERDEGPIRESHENGILTANECLEIQAVIRNDSEHSLFDELINEQNFRNDTSQIVIDGFDDECADEAAKDKEEPIELQCSNCQQKNQRVQVQQQKNPPDTNLHKDLLVEQNFYLTLKKTVNLPKAVGKYLHKYHTRYQYSLFQGYPAFFNRINEDLNDLQEWIKKSKKNSFKLCNLVDFFNDTVNKTSEQCGLNRIMMRKILVRYLRKEIIPNNQVKDKKEYLVGSKVFALRCSNATLATRMQMR